MRSILTVRPLALLLAMVLLAFAFVSCNDPQPVGPPAEEPPAEQPEAELKIMTFNVLNGWNTSNIGTRDDKTADKIFELMPDVMGFQEFDDYYRHASGTSLIEMISDHYAEAGEDAQSWNPIFYNKSTVELIQCGHVDYSVGTSYNTYVYNGQRGSKFRTIAWALLRHKASGRQFLVCNTHLDVEEEKQPLQVAELQSKVTELRSTLDASAVFLLGDLNSNTSSNSAKSLFEYGFSDTHELAEVKDNSHSCGKQGEPVKGTYRGAIDHVYCIGDGVTVSKYATVTDIRDTSDHCPVVVELIMR